MLASVRIFLGPFLSVEERRKRQDFLPYLRRVFRDALPATVYGTAEQQDSWQKITYQLLTDGMPGALPGLLYVRYFRGIISKEVRAIRIVFCGSGVLPRKYESYVDLFLLDMPPDQQEYGRLPGVQALTPEDEYAAAVASQDDPVAASLNRALDDPACPVIDMAVFFENRFQWLRDVLLECDRAIDLMLGDIRWQLGLLPEFSATLEEWEMLGHLMHCSEQHCREFWSDWHTIIHMDKYYPYEELYAEYTETFNKWGIYLPRAKS